MTGGPLTPDELARRIGDLERDVLELAARKLPEPRATRFLLVCTLDGPLYVGYHKGRLVAPDWFNAYSITTYALTMSVASDTTVVGLDVDGSDATTISVPASTALVTDGELAVAIGPGQGPKPYVKSGGTGGDDLVLVLGCQASRIV